MILAWLLVRHGVEVDLVERHRDFSREFRGEGIQESVVEHLRALGLLEEIEAQGIGVPAKRARIHFDGRAVTELGGVGRGRDFGMILYQERFLDHLHRKLLAAPGFTSHLGHTAEAFVREGERTLHVRTKGPDGAERDISADLFFVTAGRGTALRRRLGLSARRIATHWNILWIELPAPADPDLVPQGFRAYLDGRSLFILYPNAKGGIQLAWGAKDERVLKERDFDAKKRALLATIPKEYRTCIERDFTPETRTQFLKVDCDRLEQWYAGNVMFLGDAAHTMTPVAGQGINLAVRDSIVAANHVLAGGDGPGDPGSAPEAIFRAIQQEREGEVRVMQRFQKVFGFFMLGAPRPLAWVFFNVVLRVMTVLGVKRRMLRLIQRGTRDVRFAPVSSQDSSAD